MNEISSRTYVVFTNVQGDVPYDFRLTRRLPLPDQVGNVWVPSGYINTSDVSVYKGFVDLLGMIEKNPAFRNATFDTLNSFEDDLRLLAAGFALTIGAVYGLYSLDEGLKSDRIISMGKHVNSALRLNGHAQHPDLTKNMFRLQSNSKIQVRNEGQVVWEHSPR